MISGIGVDLVDKARFINLVKKFGDRAATKILSKDEYLEYKDISNKPSFLSKRFAAKEALSKAQWTSVMLAAMAVLLLTIGLSSAPWIALILAFSFSYYAVLKKKLKISPMVSVTAEVFILTPPAVILMIYFNQGPGSSFGKDLYTSFLLALSGPLTAAPLILFTYGALRVSLSTAGILQYLNPSLQFFCAAYIFMEPLTNWHMIAFPMIWLALFIYSFVGIKKSHTV